MLQFIRDKSQGVIAFVVFFIIAISFALWGIRNYFYGNAQNATVVKVNGQKISNQTLAMSVRRAQTQAQGMGMSVSTQDQLNQLKKHVLNSLVFSTLLHQSALKNGFAVSPTLLEMTLAKLPMFQENGTFSQQKFESMLMNMGYTQQEFLKTMASSLLLQQVHSGIADTTFSLPYQVNRALSLIKQKRDVAYFVVPASHFSSQVKITDADIKKYYLANAAEFTVPEKISVNYVTLSLKDLEKAVKYTPANLRSFYESNLSVYTIPKQWKVDRIVVPLASDASDNQVAAAQKKMDGLYAEIKSGKTSFAALEKKYPATDVIGHNGWVNVLESPKSMQVQLLSLNKAGEVSKPFQTANGFELLKIVAYKPSKTHPYNEVAGRVKQLYIQQKAQKEFSNLSDRLANIAFEHPDSLQPAAKALHLKVQASPLFEKNGGKGLFANPHVLNSAFGDEVLNSKNNSDLINVSDTEVMVLRVNKKIPARLKPIAEVTPQIRQELSQQQMTDKAQALADSLAKQVNSIESLNSVAAKQGFPVKHVNDLTPHHYSKTIPVAVVEAAFAMPTPAGKIDPSVAVTLNGGSQAVIVLTKVNLADPKKAESSERQAFSNANQVSLGNIDYALYMQGLKQKADIKYYKTNGE